MIDFSFITPDFIDYITNVEGCVYIKGRHLPYPSPEGGANTVGYGHKIKPYENFDDGLSEQEARELLIADLKAATLYFIQRINAVTLLEWKDLDDKRRQMLIDFVFNLGDILRKFPKFVKAIFTNDLEGMRVEYKRYYRTATGKVRELERRNKLFYERYLNG